MGGVNLHYRLREIHNFHRYICEMRLMVGGKLINRSCIKCKLRTEFGKFFFWKCPFLSLFSSSTVVARLGPQPDP